MTMAGDLFLADGAPGLIMDPRVKREPGRFENDRKKKRENRNGKEGEKEKGREKRKAKRKKEKRNRQKKKKWSLCVQSIIWC